MAILKKLAGLAAVSGIAAGPVLLRKFLSGLASVVVLMVIAGMLTGSLIMGALYLSYRYLVQFGLDPVTAMLAVGMVIAVAIALTVMAICSKLKLLFQKDYVSDSLSPIGQLQAQAAGVLDAFVDGLMTRPHPK